MSINDKEELKDKIDIYSVQERIYSALGLNDTFEDYIVEAEDKWVVPLTPLEAKLIEKIEELEIRIKTLEDK